MKKIAVLYSECTPILDALKYNLSNYMIDCLTNCNNTEKYDLVICLDEKINYSGKGIACHYSLLPAFNDQGPIKEAILNGVKVTGITFYYTDTKKIIAQYPVFINNDTHYDNLKQEMLYLEQTFLPLIAEKIINNEPFEIRSLLNKGCNNTCGGCASCKH